MTTSTRPAVRVRVRPVPRVDGPYDDEVTDPISYVDGSLALSFPAPTRTTVPLRLVPPACTPVASGTGGDEPALPDPRAWTARLTQAVVEVIAGARPASQLSRFTTLEILAMLERNTGRLGEAPWRRQPGPTRPGRRPVISSVHVSQPRPDVAEACAVVDTGQRRRAIALRLEGRHGRWRCTALQLG